MKGMRFTTHVERHEHHDPDTRLHEGALCTQTAKDHQLTWNRRVRQRWLLLEPSSHKTQPVRTAIAELR